MSTQQADLEDEVETPEVSNKWGAQDLKKATSEVSYTCLINLLIAFFFFR